MKWSLRCETLRCILEDRGHAQHDNIQVRPGQGKSGSLAAKQVQLCMGPYRLDNFPQTVTNLLMHSN
jgi:hypothetical protein